jgi:putative ABC transport system ATP-binding protein
MEIKLNKLLPYPIAELDISKSDIWNKDEVYIQNEERILVKAASGKGKTTLLYIIYGLRNDFTGKIMINNKDNAKLNLKLWTNIRRFQFSIVYQGLRLFPELSAIDNILLKNRLTNKYPKKEIIEMAELLNVSESLTKYVSHLSFGQQQRIAIIRALCQPFEFLLLDEPFSHLDNNNIEAALNLINEVCKKQNAGIILTSLADDYGFQFDKVYEI